MRLVLSPHYDDAAYSLGGLLHRWTREGHTVTILTVMAADPPDPPPDSPIVREVHARWEAGENPVPARRKEDETAARILGAALRFGPAADCIYRCDEQGQALYPDEAAIFGAVRANDPAPKMLDASLGEWTAPEMLLAPLAAGHHVDHQIVQAWARRLAARWPGTRLYFYADYPYSRDTAVVQQALDSLAEQVTARHFALSEADIEAHIRAAAAYRSQRSTFWEDDAALSAEVRAEFAAGITLYRVKGESSIPQS